MMLVLQCVGSMPATADLAEEMNAVLAKVDAVAAQEVEEDDTLSEEGSPGAVRRLSGGSEKAQVLEVARECIKAAALDATIGQLTVRIAGPSLANVSFIVCVLRAIMTASAAAEIPVSIALEDPAPTGGRPGVAVIEVLHTEEDAWTSSLSLAHRRAALLESLDLFPDEDLKFIEEEVLAFVADPSRVSPRIRLVLQALDAARRTPDLEDAVSRVLEQAAQMRDVAAHALDFSYLVDIDHLTSTASMRFQLSSDEEVPETLATIRLVLESCVESGATLLSIELWDGDKSVVVAVSPVEGNSAAVKLSVVDPRCAVRVGAWGDTTSPPRAEAPGDIAAGWGPEDQHEGGVVEQRMLNCSMEAHAEEIPRRVHVVLQALGAAARSPDLEAEVARVNEAAKRSALTQQALDFSYLVDLDESEQTATLRFDLSTDDKVPETLAVIRLVLEACVEAGASLLSIQLVDGSHAAVIVHVCPESGAASLVGRAGLALETLSETSDAPTAHYEGAAMATLDAFVQLSQDELDEKEGKCEELLFSLAHVVLEVPSQRERGAEAASALAAQRTRVYDATMALLEVPAGERDLRTLRIVQLHVKRLLSLCRASH